VSTERLRVDARSCALIIQDLQNDVITEAGAFADSGAPGHAKSQGIVANAQRLADAARSAGTPVIHVHYIVEAGARGLKQNAPSSSVSKSRTRSCAEPGAPRRSRA